MAARITSTMRGFGVLLDLATAANIDRAASSFSESGPRPGSAVPPSSRAQLEPRVTAHQGEDLSVYVTRGGTPGVARANAVMSAVYKLDSEAATEWKGWNPPTAPAGWRAIEWTDTLTFYAFDVVTIPSSQAVICVYGEDLVGVRSKRLEPSTWEWYESEEVVGNDFGLRDIAACVLPSGRVLALVVRSNEAATYYSDDEGSTWSKASVLSGLNIEELDTPRPTMACDASGQITWLRSWADMGTWYVDQHASSTLGASFSQVGSTWSSAVRLPTVLALASGALMLVGVATAGTYSGQATARVIGSAYAAFEDATEVEVYSATTISALCAWVDADGAVYVLAGYEDGTTTVRVSYDEGVTWTVPDITATPVTTGPFYVGSASYELAGTRAAASMGRAVVAHNWNTGSEDGSIGCLYVGGWSNVEHHHWVGLSTNWAGWIPIVMPADTGYWSETGTADASLVMPGELLITTTGANLRTYFRELSAGAYRSVSMEGELTVVSGGSLTNTSASMVLTSGDGTALYRIQINCTTTQFRIRNNTTTISTITPTGGLTVPIQIRAVLDAFDKTAHVWWKRHADDSWTKVVDGAALSLVATAAQNRAQWGALLNGTAVQRWRYVRHAFYTAGLGMPAQGLDELQGRPLSSRPYPAPGVGESYTATVPEWSRSFDFRDGNVPAGWVNGGDANWFVTSADSTPGVGSDYTLRSGAIGNNQSSFLLYWSEQLRGEGFFNYWRRVSSEATFDTLNTYLNGALEESISGVGGPWAEMGEALGTIGYLGAVGVHTVTTLYQKDVSAIDGDDAGWLGRARWTRSAYTETRERVGWLSAVAGPGLVGETYSIPAEHDYPVENLLWQVSPSPRQEWRTVGTDEAYVVWRTASGGGMLGEGYLAFALLGCNFASAEVSLLDDAAGADSVPISLIFGQGNFTVTTAKRTVTPTNDADASRYLQEGELAGGTIYAAGVARRIKWNTAGFFRGPAAGKRCRITIADDEADMAVATGVTAQIWLPNIVVLVPAATGTAYNGIQLLLNTDDGIPADGQFRCGAFVPLRVMAVGQAWDWGWSHGREPNADIRRDASGTSRGRRLGPAPRTLTVGWQSGVDHTPIRTALNTPASGEKGSADWWGTTDGTPAIIGAKGDVWTLIEGLLELTESGAVPVVVLNTIPAAHGANSRIDDPTQFLYGRIESAFQVDHVVGEEGVDELLRGGSLTIREIV